MHKEKEITIDGRKIVARDLSPKQIDKLLSAGAEVQEGDNLGALLGSDLTTEAVSMATGLKMKELLEGFSLEQLPKIWEATEQVNGFLLKRLTIMLNKMEQKLAAKSLGG